MKDQLLDRVTTRRIEKYQVVFKILAAICAIGAIIATACIVFVSFVKTFNFWFDYSVLLLMPLLYTAAIRELAKNRKGQFIEWWTDRIVYKTKNDTAAHTLSLDVIEFVTITRIHIEIVVRNGGIWLINLDDFADFSMREHIKENFERLNFKKRPETGTNLSLLTVTEL